MFFLVTFYTASASIPRTMDMDVWVTNVFSIVVCKVVTLSWVGLFSSFIAGIESQGLYKLELNEKAGEGIYVAAFQVLIESFIPFCLLKTNSLKADGYARDNTLLKYKEDIKNPLFSYTYCHRFQMFYTRPRLAGP